MVMGIAGKFLNPQKLDNLSKAFDKTQELMKLSPMEAMQRAGVKQDDIQKAKNLLENPIASGIMGLFGVDKQSMTHELDNLSKPQSSSPEQAPVDELARLRKNLEQLR